MDQPESDTKFVPRRALQPSPQLYHQLVGDSMENLATATLAQVPSIPAGSILHDNGCGTGAATRAIFKSNADVSIKATDINEAALSVYSASAAEHGWPAQASQMDSQVLSFPADHFTHSIANALLFVLPDDGVSAVKEAYRTLKPGGVLLANSWHYVPNMTPLQTAARLTRQPGTPLPRQGLQKWESPDFLRDVVEKGGFESVRMVKADVYCTTVELNHFATMLWSFVGGTGASRWLESDEERWDEAIEIVKKELRETEEYQELEDGRVRLKFVANVAIATK